MSEKKKFYLTTPIYYPSGNLHLGHTYTTVAADALARFKRLAGFDVKFLTGTDEHGQKIQLVAEAKGLTPIQYLDGILKDVKKLWSDLEISYDDFIRTTEPRHEATVQAAFQKLYDKGDIYKGEYEGFYCTPCESFWTESQLKDGKCPDCGREVHIAKEEAYFFKLSKYQEELETLFAEDSNFLLPATRKKEMVNNFLKPGLDDLCVSRTTFDWGIKVPFDDKHVIYVWFDAVLNYISALGYSSDDEGEFEKFWPADVHLVGKEIIRFHTLIWPAMLMALDLPLPKQVFGHGWILFDNDKMSKSKGNVMYAEPLIELYGIDALKYFLLREFSFGSDGSFTREKFLSRINSDLANDLGNLVSRTIAMIEKYNQAIMPTPTVTEPIDKELKKMAGDTSMNVEAAMDKLDFSGALESIWKLVSRTNKYIDETTPWILAKDEERKPRLDTVLYNLSESIRIISILIRPFMEKTSNRIWTQLGIEEGHETTWDVVGVWGTLPVGRTVIKGANLFPRLDIEKELIRIDEENAKFFAAKTGQPIAKPAAKSAKEAEEKEAEEKEAEDKDEIKIIEFDDFTKVDLRVATIVEAKKHPNADKLLVLQVQLGEERRQIVSGIAKHYQPDALIGKQVMVVTNLKPRKLRGEISHGMILAAEDKETFTLATVADSIASGTKVW
ncbi:methionine--tRNA ligase [Gottschalkiaceae bacterium SANA]|nr:methionine--tRNA ligase [Gottschalkiaceae bacterium SANA]